jgi:hypothetical protein
VPTKLGRKNLSFYRQHRQAPFDPYEPNPTVNFFQRYWAAGLVLVILVIHAAIIGYVRTSVARLNRAESETIELGWFRFQNSSHLGTVYQFRLHAVANPIRRYEAEQVLKKKRVEIHEASEQLLRQINAQWLADPAQLKLRDRLLEVVSQQLSEPLITRVLITDWLELPTGAVAAGTLASAP